MAASEPENHTRRLFMTDAETKIAFLIDTGADLCVFPRRMIRGPRQRSTYELSAANGMTMMGQKLLSYIADCGVHSHGVS